MKIAFLHPDLGIGGAERLLVDAAIAVKSKGHCTRIFTSHHNRDHCFPETKDGSLDVIVIGDWLPRSICGRFLAVFAYFRMMYAALYLMHFSDFKPDVIFCDQVSVCIPILRRKNTKVIFYCHFPDQLLTQRRYFLKKLYRMPLDWFEEKTTGMADVILVNSNFTAQVVRETFPSLKNQELYVLYPSINVESILRPFNSVQLEIKTKASTIFLSLNRYERKKNISLAIEAMYKLKLVMAEEKFKKIHLIIAGGYDERVCENREHFIELNNLVNEFNLRESVSFLKSPNDDVKRMLYHSSTAVLYTPSNEHFGIVPLEAMLFGRPVIACDSGGPLETVLHAETGFLCSPTAAAFADKMSLLAQDHSLARELGVAASEHVRRNFAFHIFADNLNSVIEELR